MKNIIAGKNIAILGGGPVGLTTARLLQLKGASVLVYERDTDAEARILGGTLDIHSDTGQKAIKAAGLLEKLYEVARPTTERMGTKEGNISFEMPPSAENPFDRPEVDRPDLRNILLNSLKENTVIWDAHAVAVIQSGEKFMINFESGNTATADLVIIADGSMSKARKFITESVPTPTGTYCIEGTVLNPAIDTPVFNTLVNNGNLAIVDDKKTVFIHTKGNGHFCFYVSFRQEGDWLKENGVDFKQADTVVAFLMKLFAGWNGIFGELFRGAATYRGFPLRIFSDFEGWKPHTNITLAGDAAHVMPPFGGLGVNLGLQDALTLTENLTNGQFPDIPSALNDYEQKMIAYTLPHLEATKTADDRIHTQNATVAERMERMKKMQEDTVFANRSSLKKD